MGGVSHNGEMSNSKHTRGTGTGLSYESLRRWATLAYVAFVRSLLSLLSCHHYFGCLGGCYTFDKTHAEHSPRHAGRRGARHWHQNASCTRCTAFLRLSNVENPKFLTQLWGRAETTTEISVAKPKFRGPNPKLRGRTETTTEVPHMRDRDTARVTGTRHA